MGERSFDVLIVGGGVIGSSIAYFLSAADEARSLRIALAEADPSYVSSSTALSVGGVRQQFSTAENILMSRFSVEFFRGARETLAVGEHRPDLGFREAGYLFLATEEGFGLLERNQALQHSLGAPIELLGPPDLEARFPWLNVQDLAGGALGTAGEGWLDPYTLLLGFRGKARDQAVELVHDEVVGVDVSDGKVHRALFRSGLVARVGALVNAAGPKADAVARMAGVHDLPVRPRKRFVFRFHCREKVEGAPLTIDPTGVYFRPEGEDFLGGMSPGTGDDPDSLDLDMDYTLFDEIIWPTLAHRVPAFESLRLRPSWAGHYAVNTRDQNAILGPHPTLTNFYFANGFSGHGLQHSPAVGRALSELLLFGEYRTLDLSRFGFQRLAKGPLVLEENVV
jgi:glycine/D-amino acid oxidase-like deaminating enzyme